MRSSTREGASGQTNNAHGTQETTSTARQCFSETKRRQRRRQRKESRDSIREKLTERTCPGKEVIKRDPGLVCDFRRYPGLARAFFFGPPTPAFASPLARHPERQGRARERRRISPSLSREPREQGKARAEKDKTSTGGSVRPFLKGSRPRPSVVPSRRRRPAQPCRRPR